ncbi:MAG: hypothetical protein KA734_09900 [Fluviicola sp.]|nr:hypothetical protein [Fluviicola sp.]
MTKFFVTLLTSVLFASISFSQSYPMDKEKFVKVLQGFTNEYLNKEQRDFLKEELQVSLTNGSFPEAYFKQMVETCNLLETKRLKPYPDVYSYVFSVYSFVKNKQPASSFSAWHNSVDKLLEARNIKKFSDFIELSAGFFSQHCLAESSGFQWYFYGDYIFEFNDRPLLKLVNGTLICGVPETDKNAKTRFSDSIVVYETNGIYDPVTKKMTGNGGKINWLKTGIAAQDQFAVINKYDVSLKNNDFSADSVLLTSPYFPGKPSLGKINESAMRKAGSKEFSFPQFISYERNLVIPSIRPGMNYEGGFSLEGAAFIGVGTAQIPAKITILKENVPFIDVKARYFKLSPDKITANNAAIVLRLKANDSIAHPGLEFRYNQTIDVVEFSRGKSGNAMAPFSDSYHQLDWYVPKVSWSRGSDQLSLTFEQFGTSQEQRIARFESKNFYDDKLFDKLQGLDQIHPLVALNAYSYKYDETLLDEGKAATALGKTVEQCKITLIELSSYGFISYDSESKLVRINDKLINFVQARAGKKDFDNLSFVSDMRPKMLSGFSEEDIQKNEQLQQLKLLYKQQTEERRLKKEFGYFSLKTLEMKLDAVDQVRLSDAQATFLLPDSGKITVQQNRDFEFNGWVNAGKFETQVLLGKYLYAANKILLAKTNKSRFNIRPLRPEDGAKPMAMSSYIYGITGEIVVDDPSNRSGNNLKIHQFPLLKTTQATKVYYASPTIYRGAYDSTRFYYTVNPFEIDSLDNFKEKSLRLKGELTSAGIFPVIKEDLKIMNDYSFGFSTTSPAEGYVFYGTKAKYNNKVILSNNGLQGAGKIDFIQSTSVSKVLFTFLPDSTIGLVDFVNKPQEVGVQFPDVTSKEAFMIYLPRKEVLKVTATPDFPLAIFNNELKLKGTLTIRPTGMSGSGNATLSKANLSSYNFQFKRFDISADTSVFNLKNTFKEEGEEDLAFRTDNVVSHISFKDRVGKFESNNGASTITFPNNQYICKMDVFTWKMDNDAVELGSKESKENVSINSDLKVVTPNFFSIHPKQDSLQFRAPKATFDMKKKTIFCYQIAYIDVADARIFPDSMQLVIRKKAVIDPLENSKIVANYITKYHTFTGAKTQILARRSYQATGIYPYYDADSIKTELMMSSISVDSAFQTVAKGKVENAAGFKLSKQFDYYGAMTIKSTSPLIYFNGATRINHECEKFPKNWMSFAAQVDPKNIQIPVSQQMKTLDGDAIAAGIVWRDARTKDSIRLYPTFLSTLENVNDPMLITASGLLQYDFKSKEYQIASKEKLADRNAVGNFLALHTESCSLNGDGVINLGMDYGPLTVEAVGTVSYDQSTGVTDMNTTMKFNLPLDKGTFEKAAERIVAYSGSKPLDFSTTTLEQAILNWSDRKTADKVKEEFTLSPDKKLKRVPNVLDNSIVLTGVRLKSIPTTKEEKGLMTSVNSASLVNFYGQSCMRQIYFKAFFEQLYSQNGDHFIIQMEIPGGPNYLMNYKMIKNDGLLSIVTNDSEVQNTLLGLKEDKRKSKNFLYEISTNSVFLGQITRLFE